MAKQRLQEIRKARIKCIKELEKLGVDPYPSKVKDKFKEIKLAREALKKSTSCVGRILAWRTHGHCIFADIKDESGKIQIFFQEKNLKAKYKILKHFDIGDFVYISGSVFKTKAGEITIDVKDFQLLSKSIRPLPSAWHGLKDVEERYRQRYVDLLMNEDVKKVFKIRAKVVKLLRKYLEDNGFVDVKTPALQPIYGGASALPFITHHNALDIDLYLRIADELYLKRLIVGGFEKVYEICTDYRNEGIDRWHNPEFTMLEFYWAYADYEDLMTFTEEMLSSIAKKVRGSYKIKYGENLLNFKPPWKRLIYKDAILEASGIDIDKVKSLSKAKEIISDKKLKVDMKDVKDMTSLMDAIFKSLIRPNITDPVFIIDHPYSMRPLAKRKKKDPSKVESIQPVVAGAELLNAYTELNDPVEQQKRWEEDMKRAEKGVKEFQMIDKDYIRALEYGMPPTAGWGMGVDRFVAILTNQHSIKDTILFPTLKPEK